MAPMPWNPWLTRCGSLNSKTSRCGGRTTFVAELSDSITSMPNRLAQKLLIVGWDAADWKIIDRLLAQDLMPTVRGLLDKGSRGGPRISDAHRDLASIYRMQKDRTNAPRHRDIVIQLLADRCKGQVGAASSQREAPMGPQEWAMRLGVTE